MNALSEFWNLILESNTFNFIILVVLFVIVAQKLNIADAVSKLKDEIVNAIENSKLAKENALKHYNDAKSKIEHIEDEISEKLSLANKQADNVAESIAEATARKIKQIEENVKKVSEAEGKTLIAELTGNTARESIDLARKYVKSRLKNEPDLHNRYIEESIDELDKVKI